jgi:hypothetical protein
VHLISFRHEDSNQRALALYILRAKKKLAQSPHRCAFDRSYVRS